MTQAPYPAGREQTIGEVLDGAFRIFQRTVVRTLPISVLAVLLGQGPNLYLLSRGLSARTPPHIQDPGWLAVIIASTVLISAAHYAMLRRQFAIIRNVPTRLRDELIGAFRRIPTIVALLIVQLVALAIGTVVLILPALYLMVPMAVAWPVVALEERGAVDSCKRALQLTRGSWWRVATTATVALIVFSVFVFVAAIFLGLILQLARGGNDVELMLAASRTILLAVTAFLIPFYPAALIAIYQDLLAREKAGTARREPSPAAAEGQTG